MAAVLMVRDAAAAAGGAESSGGGQRLTSGEDFSFLLGLSGSLLVV